MVISVFSSRSATAGADAMHSRSRRRIRPRVLSNNNVGRHCEEQSDEAIQNFAVALDCFASLAMTKEKASGTPADAVFHDPHTYGARGAPRREGGLRRPSASGALACRRSTNGTCGSDRTPPLSSSSRASWDGTREGWALPTPGRPSAAGDIARRPVVMPAGRFGPEPPGSEGDSPARGNRTRPSPPASPGRRPYRARLIRRM